MILIYIYVIIMYIYIYIFIYWGGGFRVLPRLVGRVVGRVVGSLVWRVVGATKITNQEFEFAAAHPFLLETVGKQETGKTVKQQNNTNTVNQYYSNTVAQ